jgi:hypothetical protein
MADSKKMQEAYVRELPPDLPEENVGAGDPKSNLPSVKVDASDVEPDPRHAGPEKLGRPKRDDPNAALRKARGVGPGLQDSEVINPAVWVDEDSESARKASADAHVEEAQRALDRAKEAAKAVKEGKPLPQEIR